jgi:hypothetical protein
MNIGPDLLRARLPDLRKWLDSEHDGMHTVHLVTRDELWCDAQFHRIAVEVCEGELEAFARLWRLSFAHWEGREIGPDDAEMLIDSFGDAAGLFASISDDDWATETARVTDGIRQWLREVRSGARRVLGTDTSWGVFEDGRRVADDTAFDFLARGVVVDGVAVQRQWNDVALFVRTRADYVLFTWGTAA